MTDALTGLVRILSYHSETLLVMSQRLQALSEEYARLAACFSELQTSTETVTDHNPDGEKAPDLLRSSEAAAYLGLKKQTLAGYRMYGGGPKYVRLGIGSRAPVAYLKADLDGWLKTRRFKSTSDESENTDT